MIGGIADDNIITHHLPDSAVPLFGGVQV